MSTPAAPPRRRPAPLRGTVSGRTALTPRIVRVTVSGLDDFAWVGPAAHLKLMLPDPGAVDVRLPPPDEAGTVVFDAATAPVMRTYTPRRFEAGELTLDVVLHGDGVASDWAAVVAPGARVAVSRPRAAGFVPHPDADRCLLLGDTSALPALATILEAHPDLVATVVVEVDEPEDAVLPETTMDVRYVEREPGGAPGSALAALLGELPVDATTQVWVAAEASAIRAMRRSLLGARRATPGLVTTRGYWRLGERNHPDHDTGED
ncbi:MAG: FAD-binding 9, siderophore-interacting [Mycobacterium sp.]|nr:FAD-binding 9, siderophore-interacting [Mycobacterium sp.]